MKKTLLLTFLILLIKQGYSQDSLVNVICEELTSKYSENLNPNECTKLYLATISSVIMNLPDSSKKEFIDSLDSSCPIVKKLKTKPNNLTLNPISEKDLLSALLNRKSDKKWSQEELKTEIEKYKSQSNETIFFVGKLLPN